MKTTLDSFISITSSGNDLYPTPLPPAIQEASNAHSLTILPEDVILQIFSCLSASTSRQICSVSKVFTKLASSDFIWQAIGESIFFPLEIAAKSKDISFKDFCKESLCLAKLDNSEIVWQRFVKGFSPSEILSTKSQHTTYKVFYQEIFKDIFSNMLEHDDFGLISKDDCLPIFNKMMSFSDSYLKPRDPTFMNTVKQMQLSKYKILTASETIALCHKDDTASLIHAVGLDVSKSYFDFHHAAHQNVGDTKFDFLNCTDYVISLNSDSFLMINNKLTKIHFNSADCQLLIYADGEYLWFYNSDMKSDNIEKFSILNSHLKLDDYTQISWEHKPSISKLFFS
jgi:F-box associated protein